MCLSTFILSMLYGWWDPPALQREPGDAVTALTKKSSVLEVTAQAQHF